MIMRDLGIIDRLPRIVCAQSTKANPLYQSYLKDFKAFDPVTAQPTIATAIRIGHPVSVRKAIRVLKQFDGIVEQATEDELANAAARADRTGLFNCPHTGVANGLKFPEFKIDYHQSKLREVQPQHVNSPITLEPNYDTVMKTITHQLKTLN